MEISLSKRVPGIFEIVYSPGANGALRKIPFGIHRSLARYLQWEEIPEDLEICTLQVVLSGLERMADTSRHSLLENIERLSWTKTAPLGYLFLGDFTDNLMFLECETGAIVHVDHDFYTISQQTEIENLKAYKQLLFRNFSDLLKCLFLGMVCDAETAEMESVSF
ncbi:MAG: hypothetical protein HFG00_08025 [Oscillibacter sp.]|nr:hypothetical protein [Oscillibacter sp.]